MRSDFTHNRIFVSMLCLLLLCVSQMSCTAAEIKKIFRPTSCNAFSVIPDGTLEQVNRSNQTIAVGSYGVKWGSRVSRGIIRFDTPVVIREKYPDTYIKSAILKLDCQSASCKTTAMQEYDDYVMPGVSAYRIRSCPMRTEVGCDFWSPRLSYLGRPIPRRIKASGVYALDVTTTLQKAMDDFVSEDVFAVRLHFGDERNAVHVDDNLHMEYSFGKSNTWLEVTLGLLHNAGGELVSESISARQLSDRLPWCSEKSYRVIVEIAVTDEADNGGPFSIEFAFPAILSTSGIDGNVDRNAIDVVEYDTVTLQARTYDSKIQGDQKFVIPSRVFYPSHSYSQIAYDTVAWNRSSPDARLFAVYFDLVEGGKQSFRTDFPMIGAGEPIICRRGRFSLQFYANFTWGDLDGDGLKDIVSGGYSETGFILFAKNIGTKEMPLFGEPERLVVGSKFINGIYLDSEKTHQIHGLSEPQLLDSDNDGDLDLYVNFNPWYAMQPAFFENIGNSFQAKFVRSNCQFVLPEKPAYHSTSYVDWNGDGQLESMSVHKRNIFYHPAVGDKIPVGSFDALAMRVGPCDLDADKDNDVLIGLFDGSMMYCRNIGTFRNMPYFSRPQPVPGKNTHMSSGNFSTPYVVDWDGDGDRDILSGSEDGTIVLFENTGSPEKPEFIEKGRISENGKPLVFPGDPREPNGEYWGYTSLSALDWDKDGDIDLLITQRSGHTNYYENIGTLKSPELIFRDRLKLVNGDVASPNPRVKPAFYDWNNDGAIDIIMGTPDETAAIYYNTGKGGLVFRQPEDLLSPKGGPIYKEKYENQGRSRYVRVDWNSNGLMDLMIINHSGDDWPRYFENVGSATTPLFEEKEMPRVNDQHLWVGAGHAPCAMAVDWDHDGQEDIILGGEDGQIRYYNRTMFQEPPATRRIFMGFKDSPGKIIDCSSLVDIDRYVGKMTLVDEALLRAQGAEKWQWHAERSISHRGDSLSIDNAKGDELLTFDPHLIGSYDIYLAFNVLNEPASIKARLSGDPEWDSLKTNVKLGKYDLSSDIAQTKHHFQQLYWKEADMTNKKIEIIPEKGSTVILDYISFVPMSRLH
jgi:WD40 repeat protein